MTASSNDGVKGERPLGEHGVDRLGFAEVANRIARAITDRSSAEGLVIGLDGSWGSGKSSLLDLIERSLARLDVEDRPTVIKFRPWLVGQRDALLISLFSDLAQGVANVQLAQGNATKESALKAKKTAESVRRFAYSLSKAGDLVEMAGEAWGPLKWAGKGLNALGKATENEKPDPDLAKLKAQLVNDLRDLKHRFLVTIDDVDRLEPDEVIEVLRLVRSVADFPNIIYVLCYDADRLAESISNATKLDDGAAYIEKIVQLTVMVPQPEPFELRQWFSEELARLVGSIRQETAERLKTIIDQEGGVRLRTPRTVVRTLDSVRFFLPALRDEQIDLADLVWLLLLKDDAPHLYRWIESYSANMATISFGTATISETAQESRLRGLMEMKDADSLKDTMYRHMFTSQLPGIENSYEKDGDPLKLFQKVDLGSRQKAIEDKRLASPDHYRLYFSLIGPSHAIAQSSYDQFWTSTEAGRDETIQVLLDLHSQVAQGSLRKSDVLFERLRPLSADVWTVRKAKNLLLAFGQAMDEIYVRQPAEQDFVVTSWDRAQRIVPTLFRKFTGRSSDALIDELFGAGKAVGWLSAVLRHEIFGHGRYGDQKRPESEWLLSAKQFDRVSKVMIARYRSMTLTEILAVPRSAHIFYAWKQAGDDYGPGKLIQRETAKDDELFVDLVETLSSSVMSSDRGRYAVLKSENVSPFLSYPEVLERLRPMAKGLKPNLQERAKALLRASEADSF